MTSPMPAHLTTAIRQRIAWLREAWHVDQVYAQPIPQLSDYPLVAQRREHRNHPGDSTPTFPSPQSDDVRSKR
jgi:hypothetical protein